jgi:hypothetical protein
MAGEWAAKHKIHFPIETYVSTGPPHSPQFRATALFYLFPGEEFQATGSGLNKAQAKQRMFFQVVEYIRNYVPLAQRYSAPPQIKPPVVRSVQQNKPVPSAPPPMVPSDFEQSTRFFEDLLRSMKSYVSSTDEERQVHILSRVLDQSPSVGSMLLYRSFLEHDFGNIDDEYRDDKHQNASPPTTTHFNESQANARVSGGFKEGSFNPYGNGQTSSLNLLFDNLSFPPGGAVYRTPTTITIFPPDFSENDSGDIICTYRVVGLDNIFYITATGIDVSSAYSEANENLSDTLYEHFLPPPIAVTRHKKIFSILSEMKDPHVTAEHLLHVFYHDSVFDSSSGPRDVDVKSPKPGSFNPYGNGQPETRAQFLKKRKAAGVSGATALLEWKNHVRQMRQKPKVATPVVTNNKTSSRRRRKNTVASGNIISVPKVSTQVANHLSPCAASYLKALVHPFDVIDRPMFGNWWNKVYAASADTLPCVPDFPPSMSRKFWNILRFDAFAGTNGIMTVNLAPFRLANNGTLGINNSPPVLATQATFTGATPIFPNMDTGSVLTPGVIGLNLASDYDSASLVVNLSGTGTSYRVVSAGLRVMYTGSELTRAGMYHCVQTLDHSSLSNISTTSISSLPSYFSLRVNNDWVTISYAPVHKEEYEFDIDGMVNPSSIPNYPTFEKLAHYMGIMVVGAAPSAPYRCEVVIQYEATGSNIQGKSKSESDVTGLSVVSNVVTPSTGSLLNSIPAALETIAQYVPSTIASLVGLLNTSGQSTLRSVGSQMASRVLSSAAQRMI